MISNEAHLLYRVMCYEVALSRHAQRLLKVYALAKLFKVRENLLAEKLQILRLAAILHDIAIKYCKEHCRRNAVQVNHKQAALQLIARFVKGANILSSYISRMIVSV